MLRILLVFTIAVGAVNGLPHFPYGRAAAINGEITGSVMEASGAAIVGTAQIIMRAQGSKGSNNRVLRSSTLMRAARFTSTESSAS